MVISSVIDIRKDASLGPAHLPGQLTANAPQPNKTVILFDPHNPREVGLVLIPSCPKENDVTKKPHPKHIPGSQGPSSSSATKQHLTLLSGLHFLTSVYMTSEALQLSYPIPKPRLGKPWI